MAKLMTISGKRVILNVQYSKIGYGYPRLFIEVKEDRYINFDMTVGALFNMKKEDFNDWLQDAEVVPEDQYEQLLKENNVNYAKFAEALKSLE